MFFNLLSLRFSFVSVEPIHFPAGKSSNLLRGAFGVIFRRLACTPQCESAQTCEWRATCPYARLFAPTATAPSPSGFADRPRPFVFRATHLDGHTFAPGQPFDFSLNLFDTAAPAPDYFALTFAQLAREGLGAGRPKVELTGVTTTPLTFDLTSAHEEVNHLTVRFLTPTELKSGGQLAPRPEFAILAARVRDRLSTLRELYGPGALELDFKAFATRAAQIQMTRCAVEHVKNERHSARTGQTHPLGGFIGEADYEGDLSEFVPYLRAAQWTGVGRQTTWGKGQIELSFASSNSPVSCNLEQEVTP